MLVSKSWPVVGRWLWLPGGFILVVPAQVSLTLWDEGSIELM